MPRPLTLQSLQELTARFTAIDHVEVRANQYALLQSLPEAAYFAQAGTVPQARMLADLWNHAGELLRLAQVGMQAMAKADADLDRLRMADESPAP